MIDPGRLRRFTASKVAGLSGTAAGGLVAIVLALSSCSGGSAAPGVTIVGAGTSTTFRTEPVRTTTTTIARPPDDDTGADIDSGSGGNGSPDDASDDPAGERSYDVQGGDYLVGIARDFGVTAEAIAAYNGWDSVQHPINPGQTIRIPPEDWDPDDPVGGDPDATGSSEAAAGDDGTCPDGSEQQTYRIQAGDVKGTVARRFDVTVAELDAANATTQYYAGFVIGIEIVIPC